MTTNEMLAYVAGFFDGEGSFILQLSTVGDVTPRINVTSTDEEIIDYLMNLFSAFNIECAKYKVKTLGNRKSQYRLDVCKQTSMLNFCNLIQPYLVIKAKRCTLMMNKRGIF
jgi:hypothetical protein